jgi:hypothetical protein
MILGVAFAHRLYNIVSEKSYMPRLLRIFFVVKWLCMYQTKAANPMSSPLLFDTAYKLVLHKLNALQYFASRIADGEHIASAFECAYVKITLCGLRKYNAACGIIHTNV